MKHSSLLEDIRICCLQKKETTEGFPFDEDTLVFKVNGKMFALMNLTGPLSVNLKCNPNKSIQLREEYLWIKPAYHMNKTHWNTLELDEDFDPQLLFELIDHSYELVIQTMPKRDQNRLK